MKTKLTQTAWLSRAIVALVACLAWGGCQSDDQVEETANADRTYTIRLDRGDNGAAGASRRADPDTHSAMQRALSFEMAGFSRASTTDDPQERRAAAVQAAIIDAFCKALIEARKARGRSDSNFTARFGPRLTVTHCLVDESTQVEVNLVSRGVDTTFVVHDGQLQHPPHDLQMIHRIFQETNGEFSLLGTDWSSQTGIGLARIGCYLPAGLGEAWAGNAAAELGTIDDEP